MAPTYQKDKLLALFDGSAERDCYEFQKQKLKDPETSYFVTNDKLRSGNLLTKTDSTGRRVIQAEARAKNSYGAYGPVIFECVVKGRNVDKKKTLDRELQAEIDDLLGR